LAKLIYFVITSLDGYIEDREGGITWGAPDEEVSEFATELERSVGTALYGRRMYETMLYWENPPALDEEEPSVQEFAELWQSTDKVVYSTSLADVSSKNTRLSRSFDVGEVQALKATQSRDISINGPNLAAQALRAGIVDEYQVMLTPLVLGGGKSALPPDIDFRLELLNVHTFSSGVVFLQYRVLMPSAGHP
jgi:dihydrofolate reductase